MNSSLMSGWQHAVARAGMGKDFTYHAVTHFDNFELNSGLVNGGVAHLDILELNSGFVNGWVDIMQLHS